MKRIATFSLLFLLAMPGIAAASAPVGQIVYELNGSWNSGNLGSCDTCSGTLSGIYRLDPSLHAGSIDTCLYPTTTGPQTVCGGGRVITECNSEVPGPYDASGPDCEILHPSLSPDGQEIVYATTATTTCAPGGCTLPASDTHLAVTGPNGTTQLPQFTRSDGQPAFLNSDELIFTGSDGDLYEVSTAGARLARLIDDASQAAPCPDGAIAYVHRGDIYLRTSAGLTTRLTAHGGQRPACSPDSARIAFIGRRGLSLVYTGGRHRSTRILASRRISSGPAFSPDGRDLAITLETRNRRFSYDNCTPGLIAETYSLEVLNLGGHRTGGPYRIADSGIDDGDCGGHDVTPGAVSWSAAGF